MKKAGVVLTIVLFLVSLLLVSPFTVADYCSGTPAECDTWNNEPECDDRTGCVYYAEASYSCQDNTGCSGLSQQDCTGDCQWMQVGYLSGCVGEHGQLFYCLNFYMDQQGCTEDQYCDWVQSISAGSCVFGYLRLDLTCDSLETEDDCVFEGCTWVQTDGDLSSDNCDLVVQNCAEESCYTEEVDEDHGCCGDDYDLVLNGGFETDEDNNDFPDNWRYSNSVSYVDNPVHGGGKAVNIPRVGGYTSQTISVVPNTQYMISYWAKGDGEVTSYAIVLGCTTGYACSANNFDAPITPNTCGQNYNAPNSAFSQMQLGSEYVHYSCSFTTSENMNFAMFSLSTSAIDDNPDSSAYYDDVKLISLSDYGYIGSDQDYMCYASNIYNTPIWSWQNAAEGNSFKIYTLFI